MTTWGGAGLVRHGDGEYVSTPLGPLYVEVEGSGPPVVLVSGGPGVSHVHYHPWFSRLAGEHTVVYYDHPGVGRSGRQAGRGVYTVAAYAAAIESVRVHLGADTVALVGLSFGGLPAIEYTRTHPGRVRRLVMSNAVHSAQAWQRGNIDSVNHEISTRYPEVWGQILALRERGVLSLADEYQELIGGVLPELEWADRLSHPALTKPAEPVDRYNPGAYAAFLGPDPEWTVGGSLAGYDPGAGLAGLDVPVLIVSGRHDRVTPVAVAHMLREQLPAGTTRWKVFENGAHRPWAEEPDPYFAELAAFLAP
ncbi:alpha/beta fold hydrolase [Phytohabitans sp. LJ34]|uniref:alpha/beta fold hydrolase n=1 Tax=Phytohabitans sp. LJ34 TaxID=3452217 RepID=UPI003F8B92EA